MKSTPRTLRKKKPQPPEPLSDMDSVELFDDVRTIKDWRSNESLQAELKLVLKIPILRQAFQTLILAYLPTLPPTMSLGGEDRDLAHPLALRHAHRSGLYDTIRALFNLTKPMGKRSTPADPWGKLNAEDE